MEKRSIAKDSVTFAAAMVVLFTMVVVVEIILAEETKVVIMANPMRGRCAAMQHPRRSRVKEKVTPLAPIVALRIDPVALECLLGHEGATTCRAYVLRSSEFLFVGLLNRAGRGH